MKKLLFFGFAFALSAFVIFTTFDYFSKMRSNVLGVLSGISESPWPMFHGDKKLTGQSPYDTSRVDGSILWRFKAKHWIESSPVIGPDNTIYFADHTCNLYAIDPSGNKKWEFSGGDPVYSKEWKTTSCSQSTPAVSKDGTIYFLPMTGNLFAVNPNGTEKWRFPVFVFKNVWTSPAIGDDGTIYVGSEAYPPSETGKPQEKTAHVYAINPNGTLKWTYDTRSVWVTSTPSIGDDNTIYTSGGMFDQSRNIFVNAVYAFNQDGSIKWTFAPPLGVLEGSISIDKDGTLYFPVKGEKDPRNARFYALTPEGNVKWSYPLTQGASTTPAIAKNGNIYFGDWGGTFYAFDKEGKLLWKVKTPSAYETLSSSPSLGSEGTIYFGSTAMNFHGLKSMVSGLLFVLLGYIFPDCFFSSFTNSFGKETFRPKFISP